SIYDCAAAHRLLHSFPTRRSSDLVPAGRPWSASASAMIAGSHSRSTPSRSTISGPGTAPPYPGLNLTTANLGAPPDPGGGGLNRSEEHTSELQSRFDLVCRLLLEK